MTELSALLLALGACLVHVVSGADCVLPVPPALALFGPAPRTQPQELARVPARKYAKCVARCCLQSAGLCNVVTFTPRQAGDGSATKPGCILYHCDAIRDCRIPQDDGVQVFADTEVVTQALAVETTAEPLKTFVKPPPHESATEKAPADGGQNSTLLPTSTSRPLVTATPPSLVEMSEGPKASAENETGPGTWTDSVDNAANVSITPNNNNTTSSLSEATPDSEDNFATGNYASKENTGEDISTLSPEMTLGTATSPSSTEASIAASTPGEDLVTSQIQKNENDSTSIPDIPEPPAAAEMNVSTSSGNDTTEAKSPNTVEEFGTGLNNTVDVSSNLSPSSVASSHSRLQPADLPSANVTPDHDQIVASNSTASSANSEAAVSPNSMNSSVSRSGISNTTDSADSNSSTPQNAPGSTSDFGTPGPSSLQHASLPAQGTDTGENSTDSSSGMTLPSEEVVLPLMVANSSGAAEVAEAAMVPTEGLGETSRPPNASSGVAAESPLEGEPGTTAGNDTAGFSDRDDVIPALPLSTVAVLICALTIGCFFFFVTLVLLGKRLSDGWKKRHYSRIERDYLIDGMYSQ